MLWVCKRPASVFRDDLQLITIYIEAHQRTALFQLQQVRRRRHRKEAGADLLLNAYKYLMSNYPGWIVPNLNERKRNARKDERSCALVQLVAMSMFAILLLVGYL